MEPEGKNVHRRKPRLGIFPNVREFLAACLTDAILSRLLLCVLAVGTVSIAGVAVYSLLREGSDTTRKNVIATISSSNPVPVSSASGRSDSALGEAHLSSSTITSKAVSPREPGIQKEEDDGKKDPHEEGLNKLYEREIQKQIDELRSLQRNQDLLRSPDKLREELYSLQKRFLLFTQRNRIQSPKESVHALWQELLRELEMLQSLIRALQSPHDVLASIYDINYYLQELLGTFPGEEKTIQPNAHDVAKARNELNRVLNALNESSVQQLLALIQKFSFLPPDLAEEQTKAILGAIGKLQNASQIIIKYKLSIHLDVNQGNAELKSLSSSLENDPDVQSHKILLAIDKLAIDKMFYKSSFQEIFEKLKKMKSLVPPDKFKTLVDRLLKKLYLLGTNNEEVNTSIQDVTLEFGL